MRWRAKRRPHRAPLPPPSHNSPYPPLLPRQIPLDMNEVDAADMRRKQEQAGRMDRERWNAARKMEQEERQGAEEVLEELLFTQLDRLGEREQLVSIYTYTV